MRARPPVSSVVRFGDLVLFFGTVAPSGVMIAWKPNRTTPPEVLLAAVPACRHAETNQLVGRRAKSSGPLPLSNILIVI